DVRGRDHAVIAGATILKGDRDDPVTVGLTRHRDVLEEDLEPLARTVWGEQFVDRSNRDPGLMAESADPTEARVEPWLLTGRIGQRIVAPVLAADAFTQGTVGAGAAELFDPPVLVRRDRLAGELSAEPG